MTRCESSASCWAGGRNRSSEGKLRVKARTYSCRTCIFPDGDPTLIDRQKFITPQKETQRAKACSGRTKSGMVGGPKVVP